MEGTVQGWHRKVSATGHRKVRMFSCGDYLDRLMSELDRAAISSRLAESRTQAGITQEEMADLLQVHFRSIQNWESVRVTTVPWDRLEEWAQATGTAKEWLLRGDDAAAQEAGPAIRALAADVQLVLEELRQVRELLQSEDAAGLRGAISDLAKQPHPRGRAVSRSRRGAS